MMKPMAFLPVFGTKKLPLRGPFRDGNDRSRDACGHHGEQQLSVAQHPDRDATQFTEGLGGKAQGRREEPSPSERAWPAERGTDPRRDPERDEPQHDDRRRHPAYDRDGVAKMVSPPSFRTRSKASWPSGIRASAANAKSGSRKK